MDTKTTLPKLSLVGLIALLLQACGVGPTGDLSVILEAEESIVEGLSAGEDDEDIVDGWNVTFEHYLISIGDLSLRATSGDMSEVIGDRRWIVDLRSIPATGLVLEHFDALEARRYDDLRYRTPLASASSERHESVSVADYEEMISEGYSYLIEGTLEQEGGQSCPPSGVCRPATRIDFRFGVRADTLYGPCQTEDALPGVVVNQGGVSASITIHGDHIFFDAFPSSSEQIQRRAQWIADADTDENGQVTTAELSALNPADFFPSEHYNLAGSPLPVRTTFDYLRGQLHTQGHFQGEGECAWSLP